MEKSSDALRTISEVAADLDVPKHVLRFWESKFAQVNPMKRGGGRRYYRPSDIDLLKGIRYLLYGEGFTIRGVQQIFKREGVDYVKSFAGEVALKAPIATKKSSQKKSRPKPEDVVDDHKILLSLLKEIDECRKLVVS